MSTNTADDKIEERLLKKLDDLEAKIEQIRNNQQKYLIQEARINAFPDIITYNDFTGWAEVWESLIEIDFNDWINQTYYFEIYGLVDSGTGHYRLKDAITGNPIVGSEVLITSTSRLVAKSGPITKPVGVVSLVMEVMLESPTDPVFDVIAAFRGSHIFRIE